MAIDADYASLITPMAADVLAVQARYGAPADVRGGDTVYGYGSNLEGSLGRLLAQWTARALAQPVTLTRYDTGGYDRLDWRMDTPGQRVDLRPAGISDVYGLVDNLVMARDTLIEQFITGSGDDEVAGNAVANRLEGRAGADALAGDHPH